MPGRDVAPARRGHGLAGAVRSPGILKQWTPPRPGTRPRQHGADTVLTGLLDRSALYGALGEIEALGLDLLEVRQVMLECESPESGDRRSP